MLDTTTDDGLNTQTERKGRSGNLTFKQRNIVSAIWPPERIELLKQLHPIMSHKQIAEALGTTRGSVDGIISRLGLRRKRESKPILESNRCRNTMCYDKIEPLAWPYCKSCMTKVRKKHHV
jgi:hypothetical protein